MEKTMYITTERYRLEQEQREQLRIAHEAAIVRENKIKAVMAIETDDWFDTAIKRLKMFDVYHRAHGWVEAQIFKVEAKEKTEQKI